MLISRYVRIHAKTLTLLAVLSGAGAGISILLLDFINQSAADGGHGSGPLQAAVGLGFVAALLLVRGATAWFAAHMGSRLIAGLRQELSTRFLALEPERLMSNRHAVFGALIGDVARLAQLVQMAPTLATNGLLAVLGISYLLHLSPQLFLVVVPFIALAGVLFFVSQRALAPWFDEQRAADETLFGLMRTLVEGKKELTLLQSRAWHFSNVELAPAIERSRAAQVKSGAAWGAVDAFGDALSYAWILAAVLAGGWWLGASQTLIVQFVIAGLFVSGPIHSLFDIGAQLSSGSASLRHLESLGLHLDREAPPLPAPPFPQPGTWQRIDLEGVTYAYPDAALTQYQLGPVDLHLERGEALFLCGGNGSGKSTLLMLLCGLIAPASGKILVDGEVVDPHRPAEYRDRFSAVFFDFMLFRMLIDRDARSAAPADANLWLQRMRLDEKVKYGDGELSSVDLSQGQRKRLALLQSCLDERDILVLDEITADQDREFREYFYGEFLPLLKRLGKTVVLVTHDDRYWHHADRLVVLDCGQAVERPRPQASDMQQIRC